MTYSCMDTNELSHNDSLQFITIRVWFSEVCAGPAFVFIYFFHQNHAITQYLFAQRWQRHAPRASCRGIWPLDICVGSVRNGNFGFNYVTLHFTVKQVLNWAIWFPSILCILGIITSPIILIFSVNLSNIFLDKPLWVNVCCFFNGNINAPFWNNEINNEHNHYRRHWTHKLI